MRRLREELAAVRIAARPSSEPLHHRAECDGADGLAAGWHVWEATRHRGPRVLHDCWDDWVTAVDGYVTQTAGWVEYALGTDYERAVLIARLEADGSPRAVATGFISQARWPLRGFRTIRFPAYPSTRGDDGCLQEAVEICERVACERGCMAVEFLSIGQPETVAAVTMPGYTVRQDQFEYILDLTRGEEALWEGLSRRHRRNVRLSGKRDVSVVRTASVQSVRRVRELQVEVTRRHAAKGDPFRLQPPEAYDVLHKALVSRGLGRVYCAHLEGQMVSAALYLTFGERARWLYSGSNELGLSTRASLAVIWEAIVDLRREGFRELSLGTANREMERQDSSHPAYGLHEFKLGFGARTRYVTHAARELRPTVVHAYRALKRLQSSLRGDARHD